VVGSNVSVDTSGVYVVRVACDGTLTHDEEAGHGLRLSTSIAPLPGGRALLLGGQTAFDPIDNDDTRLLSLGPPVTELAAYDLWSDAVGATRIAASPDGALVAVPNNSMFSSLSGTVKLFSVAGDVVTELDTATGLQTPSELLFSPDGSLLLVSDWEADAVHVFDVSGDTLEPGDAVSGVGLAEHLAMVSRGASAGLVLAAATNAVGNIQLLQISAGAVTRVGQLDLGDGIDDIPWTLAVQP
jgi:DNA-binding beta-propeller fold protein YncE